MRSSDINRLSEDYTNPFVSTFVYSFASNYQTKIDTITSDEVLNVNFWKDTDATKSIEKGIEAQNIKLDWVQRPNFVINGDFEDGFRKWDVPSNNTQQIKEAPLWEFVDPSDSTKTRKAKDYVSNNVLGWSGYFNNDSSVVQKVTIPPISRSSTIGLKFNFALETLDNPNISAWLLFGVYDDGGNLITITGATDKNIFKYSDWTTPLMDESYYIFVNNGNPFTATDGNYYLAGELNVPLTVSDDTKGNYNDYYVRIWGYSDFLGNNAPVVVDKVAITVGVDKEATATNNNQVETFYGGIDKQPFRKKGEDVSITIGAPSNELHLSTLYYPLGSTTAISPSKLEQLTYQLKDAYMYTYSTQFEIDYDLIIDAVKVLPSNTTANFTGYINLDSVGLGSDNLIEAEFKVNDVYLMINGTIKVQCYARFNHFWGRRGAGLDITSDDIDLSNVTINGARIYITTTMGVHSGGGDCEIASNATVTATYTQSGYAPITDYRNLGEIENRNGKDNQLCVRLLQSILTTRTESVWKLKGTLIEDIMITPNLTIFDKYLKDANNNSRYMRPYAITTDLQTMEHSVELIEIVNDVVTEGEANG